MSQIVEQLIRNEKNLRKAPAWIIYTNGVLSVVIVLSAIGAMITRGNPITLILLGLSLVFGFYSDVAFNYYSDLRYLFYKDHIECRYELDKAIMPSSDLTVVYSIRNLKKIRRTITGGIKVYGDITVKRPLKKEKHYSKISIPVQFGPDTPVLIENLKKYVKESSNAGI